MQSCWKYTTMLLLPVSVVRLLSGGASSLVDFYQTIHKADSQFFFPTLTGLSDPQCSLLEIFLC